MLLPLPATLPIQIGRWPNGVSAIWIKLPRVGFTLKTLGGLRPGYICRPFLLVQGNAYSSQTCNHRRRRRLSDRSHYLQGWLYDEATEEVDAATGEVEDYSLRQLTVSPRGSSSEHRGVRPIHDANLLWRVYTNSRRCRSDSTYRDHN